MIGTVRREIRSLTGLRFAAALVVVLHHLAPDAALPPFVQHQGLFVQGTVGVSFFFILSGFVLTWSRQPGLARTAFWRRRVARIYPAYLVGLLLGLGTTLYASQPLPWSAASTIVLLQSWVPHQVTYFSVNGPAWSLSTEAFFYLTYPLLIGRLTALEEAARLRLAAVLVVMSLTIPVVGSVIGGPPGYWLSYICPAARLPEFVLGALLALQVRSGRWPRVPLALALGLVVVAYVVDGEPRLGYLQPVAVTLLPFLLLIGTIATRESAGRPVPFSSARWGLLGRWSYCLYLVHTAVLVGVAETLRRSGHSPTSSAAGLLVAALMVGLSLGAAGLLHVCVEQPAERRLAGRADASLLVSSTDGT